MSWTLVTGGARGLGAAICLELAKQKRNIALHYNTSEEDARDVALSCRQLGVQAECVQGDFSTKEGVQRFIANYQAQFEESSGLVNNVGNYLIKPAGDTTQEEWRSLFETNFFTPIALLNALSDSLKKHRGTVVTIGTVLLGSYHAYRKSVAYSVSKSSLYQTLRSYARELAPDHVTVNMVSPGHMENSTDLGDKGLLPMQRTARLEEVARAVGFFFDPLNHYITGQNLEVAGGFGL